MLGAIIIVVVLLLIPPMILMGGMLVSVIMGLVSSDDADARHPGSELIELNR